MRAEPKRSSANRSLIQISLGGMAGSWTGHGLDAAVSRHNLAIDVHRNLQPELVIDTPDAARVSLFRLEGEIGQKKALFRGNSSAASAASEARYDNCAGTPMKLVPILLVACVVSQTALAEGLECRRVADPTPRLSCVETPTTAEVHSGARSDGSPGDARRGPAPKRDDDTPDPRSTRICRNC